VRNDGRLGFLATDNVSIQLVPSRSLSARRLGSRFARRCCSFAATPFERSSRWYALQTFHRSSSDLAYDFLRFGDDGPPSGARP